MKRTTYILLALIIGTLILIIGMEVAISLTGKEIEYNYEPCYPQTLETNDEPQLPLIQKADFYIGANSQMPEITIIANSNAIYANIDIDTIDNFTTNEITIKSDSLIHVILKK